MTDERAIELFTEFRRNFHTSLVSEYVEPPRLSGGEPMRGYMIPFFDAASDTLRELRNSINEFQRWINTLNAWQPIYARSDQSEQFSLLLQHIRPYSALVLGAPQALRGRLIYAATACCGHANYDLHHSNQRLQWADGHVSMKVASRVGQPWTKWPALAEALGDIGQGDFSDETDDFRNQREHGHPRNIALGLTSAISVRTDGESRSWAFGSKQAIPLEDVIRLSVEQHPLVCRAYRAFCELVEEQFTALMNAYPMVATPPQPQSAAE
ncbi:hypothetical protein AX279_00150 [Pseudomonas sp. J237]|nr:MULTISPECIES: hypothetical protein [Pseudomonas]OEO27853.1 hypothetical protein AX279_00150 [Pseudomonas sp. J237]